MAPAKAIAITEAIFLNLSIVAFFKI